MRGSGDDGRNPPEEANADTIHSVDKTKDGNGGDQKSGRVHPCSAEDFDNLEVAVGATDDAGGAQPRRSLVSPGSKPRLSVTKYANPDASDGDPSTGEMEMTRAEAAETSCGVVYLVVTLILSVLYLDMLTPAMSNDLWWADFNASGAHSYLIDVFNSNLNKITANRTTSDLDVTAGGFAKDYSGYYTPIHLTPIYDRIVRANQASNLSATIVALQQFSGPDSIATQYCWVDFNRTWEAAHTGKRQARCNRRYASNAAMYWETMFRLINWKRWIKSSSKKFQVSMGQFLNTSLDGREWLNRTTTGLVSVDAEVAMWKRAGLTHYALQWTNSIAWGVKETMSITNALGATQSLTIKQVAYKSRGSWTTIALSWGPWNDFMFNLPFIRSDPKHARFYWPCSYDDYLADPDNYACEPCDPEWNPDYYMYCWFDFEGALGLGAAPGFALTHDNVGPFGSIDAFFVLPPPSLLALSTVFELAMTTLLQSNDDFYHAVAAIPQLEVDPVPVAWQSNANTTFTYMGGDMTCPKRTPRPHVQSSFSFEVACTNQERHTMLLHARNALFAHLAASRPPGDSVATPFTQAGLPTWCRAVSPTLAKACIRVLGAVLDASSHFDRATTEKLTTLARQAQADVSTLRVQTIQYANARLPGGAFPTDVLLKQAVVSDDLMWDAFGWVYLFEWAEASREVVSFEGDHGTFVLVSDKAVSLVNEAQKLEVPQSACQYLWVVSTIVSVILVGVGLTMSAYICLVRGRIVGRNLFQFNRVVGAVWLGRPFLLIRGMTAIVLLSTAPLRFVARKGITSFEFHPRALAASMLVSGEAMWVTYVINDFLLLLTRNAHPHFAPLSAFLSWVIYVAWDMTDPTPLLSAVDRACDIDISRSAITCQSGSVQLGDVQRAMTLALIQVVSIVVSFAAGFVLQCFAKRQSDQSFSGHLLLSGTATAFLRKEVVLDGALLLDRASCVMCGLLTFGNYIFDLKLWLVTTKQAPPRTITGTGHRFKWNMHLFLAPDFKTGFVPTTATESAQELKRHRPKRSTRVIALIGLGYMCATVLGSVTYLTLTTTNMANDFWWANYNASREHVFLARLYNREMVLRPHSDEIALDDPIFVDGANFSKVLATSVKVYMQPLYVTQIKLEDAARLATVVRGLRNMDACLAPWIAAQYCWLDFDKRWEMANSAARQARCTQWYASNGAAYLETVLRNVEWPKLQSCWGTSLDIALAAPLRASAGDVGTAWWASLSVAAMSTSVESEVTKWQLHNISSFVTDWQNYKSIGIIDTYQVQNALGFSYPMTLKHTNGTLQLNSQTRMKMYWAFASDLWAVTADSTLMYGKSLIRQTGDRFAFRNVSMQDVLLQNGTVQGVHEGPFATFRRTIGPFGSVDLKHVAVPKSLVQFVLHVKDALIVARTSSSALSYAYYALEDGIGLTAIPSPWFDTDQVYVAGGNIFCPEGTVLSMSAGLWILTGAGVACNAGVGEFLYPSAFNRLAAVIALRLVLPPANITTYADALCDNLGRMSYSTCRSLVNNPVKFLRNTTFFPDAAPQFAAWAIEAAAAQQDVLNAAAELFQYGKAEYTSTDVAFLRHTLFDSSLPSFDMVSWLLAFEWCFAQREVISVQGDVGTINVITSSSADVTSLVNPLELPVNVASYIRYACLYVTSAIICVAFLATLYLLANRGYVEGVNMFELNRVAGIVWVGRTLLFVRGLAAISLLSTQVLTLTSVQLHWGFSAPTVLPDETTTDKALRFFKTFLAAGEVSWLGFVLSDMLIVITQQYTTAYVFKCNFMVWGASAILSLAVPTTHTATMTRECDTPQVDFQIVCTSGTVAIGSFGRFVTLIGVCVASIAVSYAYERLRHPNLKPQEQSSYFLSASAKYVFEPNHWIEDNVYYIDPASAVINGILSLQVRNTFYIFDLKIWRLFVFDEPDSQRKKLQDEGAIHLLQAIPLTD